MFLAITNKDLNLDKAEIISSVKPSAKNSFSVSFDKFLNGKITIEGLSCSIFVVISFLFLLLIVDAQLQV